MRTAAVLGLFPILVIACGDAATTADHAPSSPSANVAPTPGATSTPSSTTRATPDDPTTSSTPVTPAVPATPATDGDDEPTAAELAIDPGQDGTCKGAFNCRLPNPEPDGNRITNPATGTKLWPIAAGTAIVDGIGGDRGTVTGGTVQINYGQRKTLGGVPHVYAFSATTTKGSESSWVAESALPSSLGSMPTVLARDPGKGDYDETFTITGGDPSLYGDDKVVAGSTETNEAATDYLTRPGDVVNVLSALPGGGGVSNDTYPIGKVQFKRARGVASVYVFVYPRGSSTVSGSERFVYGHVNGRYGWVARDALTPAPATPGPSRTFCCAKCSGRSDFHSVEYAGECVTSSKAYCAAVASRGDYEESKIGDCAE